MEKDQLKLRGFELKLRGYQCLKMFYYEYYFLQKQDNSQQIMDKIEQTIKFIFQYYSKLFFQKFQQNFKNTEQQNLLTLLGEIALEDQSKMKEIFQFLTQQISPKLNEFIQCQKHEISSISNLSDQFYSNDTQIIQDMEFSKISQQTQQNCEKNNNQSNITQIVQDMEFSKISQQTQQNCQKDNNQSNITQIVQDIEFSKISQINQLYGNESTIKMDSNNLTQQIENWSLFQSKDSIQPNNQHQFNDEIQENFKNKVQEFILKYYKKQPLPTYISQQTQFNPPKFISTLNFLTFQIIGKGKNKKEAEQQAAQQLFINNQFLSQAQKQDVIQFNFSGNDNKSDLNIFIQKNFKNFQLPKYILLKQEGQQHNPIFTTKVEWNEHSAIGQGQSKKASEEKAATNLIKQIQNYYISKI